MRAIATAVSAVVLGIASTAQAVWIYGTDNVAQLHLGDSLGDRVVRFDPTNPTSLANPQVIGRTGVAGAPFTGLDFIGNTLYGVTGRSNGGTLYNGFYSVNQATGQATLIGNLNLPAGLEATDLSYDPATGQVVGLSYNQTTQQSGLFTVNAATGAATHLGMIVAPAGVSIGNGLAVSSGGTRYMFDMAFDRLRTISGLDVTGLPNKTGLWSNYSQGITIDWAGDGTMYYSFMQGEYNYVAGQWVAAPNPGSTGLYTIDTTTGIASEVVTWPNHGSGTTGEYNFGDLAVQPVPEPALIAPAILGAAGAFLRRRRQS